MVYINIFISFSLIFTCFFFWAPYLNGMIIFFACHWQQMYFLKVFWNLRRELHTIFGLLMDCHLESICCCNPFFPFWWKADLSILKKTPFVCWCLISYLAYLAFSQILFKIPFVCHMEYVAVNRSAVSSACRSSVFFQRYQPLTQRWKNPTCSHNFVWPRPVQLKISCFTWDWAVCTAYDIPISWPKPRVQNALT